MQVPSPQERRNEERIIRVGMCSYELSRFSGSVRLDLVEGRAITVNISRGGMLLLLAQPVQERTVFEIRAPSVADQKKTTKLVEVRWTRPLAVTGKNLHLAGVQFLFELPLPG